MSRPIPAFLFPFMKKVEAVELESYRDSAGVWTIGVGHTGPEVHGGLRWSSKDVDRALRDDLAKAAAKLQSVVCRDVIDEMTEHQYAALLSFVFNLGAGKDWQIWKRLNARQWDQIPVEMSRFDKARIDGKLVKLQGLVNRRNAEVALWSTDEPGSDHRGYSSGSLRVMQTPPTPAEADVKKSKAAAIGGGTALGFVGVAQGVQSGAKAVQDTLEPHAYAIPWLYKIVAAAALVGLGVAAALWVAKWWAKRSAR